MRKRFLPLGLGLAALLAGVAGFAANTAEWVNVTAHVEKEIALACVTENTGTTGPEFIVDPDGCNFGVTFPEESYEKVVELTLSNSFFDQRDKSGVQFDVLWECKLVVEDALATGLGGDNPCREDLEGPVDDVTPLDGGIRGYTVVTGTPGCFVEGGDPGSGFIDGGPAKLEFLANGALDDVVTPKCFYHLAFTAPACAGHWNPNTDPLDDPEVIICHDNSAESNDPQDWDRFADLGDSFKIQVYGFTED